MIRLIAFICGSLFGLGLAASGMTNTSKVIGFLDIFGQWDPDLLVVMSFAVLTTLLSFTLILRKEKPIVAAVFQVPDTQVIDAKLIGGAIIFGTGWGVIGYCPGPAIAALVYLQPITVVFVLFMLVGMLIGDKLSAKLL
jgi:uncharacterized membrane protein YedE/YeeE